MAKKNRTELKKKAERREKARKKAKIKNITIAVAIPVFIIAGIITLIALTSSPNEGERTFANNALRLTLLENGDFSFVDCGIWRTGTYLEDVIDENNTMLTFTEREGFVTQAFISGNTFTIPNEWDAQKGHSPILQLRR